MCSLSPTPRGSRSARMMGSARVPRCHGWTCWQPVVAASPTVRANAGMNFTFMDQLFPEQRFDFLPVFFFGFLAVEAGVGETNLARLIHQEGAGHGRDPRLRHQFLLGV